MTRLDESPRETGQVRFARFEPAWAPTIAQWAPTPQALLWLAPRSSFPLTPAKVLEWQTADGRSYGLWDDQIGRVVAYGEINPLSSPGRRWWLGHIVVDPRRRGRGLGGSLVHHLTRLGLETLGAAELSLIVFPANRRAIHCYERVGFKYAAQEYHLFPTTPIRQRLLRYELDRQDWMKTRNAAAAD